MTANACWITGTFNPCNFLNPASKIQNIFKSETFDSVLTDSNETDSPPRCISSAGPWPLLESDLQQKQKCQRAENKKRSFWENLGSHKTPRDVV